MNTASSINLWSNQPEMPFFGIVENKLHNFKYVHSSLCASNLVIQQRLHICLKLNVPENILVDGTAHNHSCSGYDGRKTLQPLKAILAEETDVDLSKNGERKAKSLIRLYIILPPH